MERQEKGFFGVGVNICGATAEADHTETVRVTKIEELMVWQCWVKAKPLNHDYFLQYLYSVKNSTNKKEVIHTQWYGG